MNGLNNINYASIGNSQTQMQAKSALAAPADEKPPTDFATIVLAAHAHVASLEAHIATLTERLVGATPQNPSASNNAVGPGGVFSQVEHDARRIHEMVQSGHDHLRRIEAALPPL